MVTWEICEAAKLDCSLIDPLEKNQTTQIFLNFTDKKVAKTHFAHNHPFMANTIIWTIITLALILVFLCVAHLMRHVKKNLQTESKKVD